VEILIIKPHNILELYEFVKRFFVFSQSDYLKFTIKKSNRWGRVNSSRIELLPHYILVPEYRYSSGLEMLEENLRVNIKKDERVRVDNFSRFTVCKIPPDNRDFRIDISLWVGVPIMRESGGKVILKEIEINFQSWKNNKREHYRIEKDIEENSTDTNRLRNELKALKWAESRKYSTIKERNHRISSMLSDFEEDWFVIVNLLYTIYAGFQEDSFEYDLLKPLRNLLKGCGDTFEEVVDNIGILTLFV